MTLIARLDKATRERVLCGVTTCRGEFGRVREAWDWKLDAAGAPVAKIGEPRRYFAFGPGWVHDDAGTWRMAKRARERLAEGRSTRLRRGLGKTDKGRQLNLWWTLRKYPVLALCPRCDSWSVVDADVIGVDGGWVPNLAVGTDARRRPAPADDGTPLDGGGDPGIGSPQK